MFPQHGGKVQVQLSVFPTDEPKVKVLPKVVD